MDAKPWIAVTGAQAAWLQAYKDIRAHHVLDTAFTKLSNAVDVHSKLLGKQAQVLVRLWLSKLCQEVGWLGMGVRLMSEFTRRGNATRSQGLRCTVGGGRWSVPPAGAPT